MAEWGSDAGFRSTDSTGWWIDGFPFPVFCILILWALRRQSSKVEAVCVSRARTVLCGGYWATGIPTATASHFRTNCLCPSVHSESRFAAHFRLIWPRSRQFPRLRCPALVGTTRSRTLPDGSNGRMSPFRIVGLPVSSIKGDVKRNSSPSSFVVFPTGRRLLAPWSNTSLFALDK